MDKGKAQSTQLVEAETRRLSREDAIRKAQALVRQHVPENVSLVDQLIEERRAEARQESGGDLRAGHDGRDGQLMLKDTPWPY